MTWHIIYRFNAFDLCIPDDLKSSKDLYTHLPFIEQSVVIRYIILTGSFYFFEYLELVVLLLGNCIRKCIKSTFRILLPNSIF